MNIIRPDSGFRVICADPPWSFKQYSDVIRDEKQRRDVGKHYGTMSISQISSLPVQEVAAKDCHLFIWTTGPKLPRTFEVIESWGFTYSAVAFTWVKLKRSFNDKQLRVLPTAEADLHVGLGFTTRKNAEFCLLARRGNAKREAKNVREIILSPVREHSRKPDEFFSRVEQYASGPYLELFARQSRPGWTTWGNEATKFDATEAA